ncbi:helix-turn-helix domain-containing protein [Stieleria sp.]|uniref:helix-turn-helix domain-containing protein n=1 Tax=Stieleria sp. TaxID=2795976 RepID=UPI00356348E2
MANSTKIRPLGRLIDKANSPFWVIGPDGRLVFLSAAVGDWLTVEPESLIGRRCLAGTSITDDPLDFLAASLAPPPGILKSGTASLLIQPTFPGAKSRRIAALDTRFVRLGQGDESITLAVAGSFQDHLADPVIDAAVVLRRQLDSWRRRHETIAQGVSVGNSRLAQRLGKQIRLAGTVRSDVLIVSPPGCFAESIAASVHQCSAAGEPIATIDGPLMDAELLDASLAAVIAHLADSETSRATAILKGIDQTPLEAQLRLVEHLRESNDRLRLIAIASDSAVVSSGADTEPNPDLDVFLEASLPVGITPPLADHLCGLTIRLHPLADRIADLPMIATAMLDRRRAGGDGLADRFARAALDAMVIYPWPDNFRELDQAIRHAMRSCPGQVIGLEHLPLAIRSYRPNESVPKQQQTIDLDQVVAQFESDLIREALESSAGNRAEAARKLNISRARLLRKLESIGDGDSP